MSFIFNYSDNNVVFKDTLAELSELELYCLRAYTWVQFFEAKKEFNMFKANENVAFHHTGDMNYIYATEDAKKSMAMYKQTASKIEGEMKSRGLYPKCKKYKENKRPKITGWQGL